MGMRERDRKEKGSEQRERQRGDRIGDEETGILRRQRGERETLEVKYYCVMVRVVSSRGQRSVSYRLAGSAYMYTGQPHIPLLSLHSAKFHRGKFPIAFFQPFS